MSKRNTESAVDKLPPHNIEAEQAVLGSVLLAPTVLPEAREVLPEGDAFYDLRHAEVWRALCALDEERVPIDLITLQARLKDAGRLEEVGGLAYLAMLPDAVPSAANLDYYVKIVREKWHARKLARVLVEGTQALMADAGGVESAANALAEQVREVNDSMTVRDAVPPMPDNVRDAVDILEKTYEHRHNGLVSPNTLPTPFEHLNRLVGGGLYRSELTVLAARPGGGKTAWARRMVEHVCGVLGDGVFFSSQEMSRSALTQLFLCQVSKASLSNVRQGFVSSSEIERLTVAASAVSSWPLVLDDRRQTVAQFKAAVRRAAREGVQGRGKDGKQEMKPLKMVVFDYAQRARTGNKYHDESDYVSEISGAMLDIALEYNVCALLLSQLNRDVEKDRGARRPRLSDLKQSGNLEQDAHVVLLNYPMLEPENNPEKLGVWESYRGMKCKPICTLIGKQRNGQDDVEADMVLHGRSVRMEDFYGGKGTMQGAVRQVTEWEAEWQRNG